MGNRRRSNRYTEWKEDSNGILRPVPCFEDTYSLTELRDSATAAAAHEYKPLLTSDGAYAPGEAEYVGMSCIAVAHHKRAQLMGQGDLQALNQYEDRVMGKPKQSMETLSVNVTLQDVIAEGYASGVMNYRTIQDELNEQYPNGIMIEVKEKKLETYGL